MLVFLLGALAGAIAVTYWHRETADLGAPRVRDQVPDNFNAAEPAVGRMVKDASTKSDDIRQDERIPANEPLRDF